MVTAIVQFRLPPTISREQAREQFRHIAPLFREAEGLVRKYFLVAEDGKTAGGAYLWVSREAAERFYNGGVRRMIAERYGNEPTITYFETPVIVDNLTGEVIVP